MRCALEHSRKTREKKRRRKDKAGHDVGVGVGVGVVFPCPNAAPENPLGRRKWQTEVPNKGSRVHGGESQFRHSTRESPLRDSRPTILTLLAFPSRVGEKLLAQA